MMQFNFFRHTQIKQIQLTCAFPHQQLIYAGDSNGMIQIFDSSISKIQSWRAHTSSISSIRVFGNFLISVVANGIKVWDLSKVDNNQDPICCRVIEKNDMSCWTILPNLSHLLIGTSQGMVVSYRGDLTRDRSLKVKTLLDVKQSITNLAFEMDKSSQNIYVTTVSKVYKLNKDVIVLDEAGCDVGLLLEAHEADTIFYIARQGILQAFGPLGPTFSIPINNYGNITSIFNHRGYIGTLTKLKQGCLLTLVDVANKFVGFSGVFTDDGVSLLLPLKQDGDAMDPLELATAGKDVQDVLLVISTSSLLVVTPNVVHKLTEMEVSEQLEILYKRHMYPLAIQLVSDDLPLTREIYLKYGDYLYSRGEYSSSIKAYMETIGTTSPSVVIRKFLDASRLSDLVEYLEALFERSKSQSVTITKDHTTLLLNCYVRLKDLKKLDNVLTWKDVNFDVETAVQVLKSSFPSHALALTKRYGMHSAHVSLLMSAGKTKEALLYVEQCKRPDQEDLMQRFGHALIDVLPQETAGLLMQLAHGCDYTRYLPLFVGHNDEAVKFLESAKMSSLPIAVTQTSSGSGLQMMEIESSQEFWDVTPHLKKLNTTLLSLYLDSEESTLKYSPKIIKLLQEEEYDVDEALISCKAVNFQQGTQVLNQRRGRFTELFHSLINTGDDEVIYQATLDYGPLDPTLYLLALDHFATKDKYLKPLLSKIDQVRIPPMVVIDRLKKRGARIGVVKEYLKTCMKRLEDGVVEDTELIQAYKRDTIKMQTHMKELQDVVTFQSSKCQACGQPLTLPTLHYYCHHSYHLSCLPEGDCPRCAPEHRMVMDLAKNQVGEDVWRKELNDSKNWEERFDVIARGFSLMK
jgi:hypothetical protein